MRSSAFLQVCAVAAVLAGVSLMIGATLTALDDAASDTDGVSFSDEARDPNWVWYVLPYVVAVSLLLVAMPGLHRAHEERAGWIGLSTHVVASLCIVLLAGLTLIMAFIPPSVVAFSPEFLDADPPPQPLGTLFMVAFVAGTIGFVILGAVHAWTGVVSRWAGAAFAIGAIAGMAIAPLAPYGDLLMAVALVWMGWSLWRIATPAVAPVEPAVAAPPAA